MPATEGSALDARIAALVDRRFPGSGAELVIGGIAARELVERFGSPIFAYDTAIMRASWEQLRAALPPPFEICYSIKANPHPRAVAVFVGLGARLEIASAGELRTALASGVDPGRILFAGPGKSVAELAAAVDAGIGEIHVESFTEASRLGAVAAECGRVVRVAIRVNPSSDAAGGAMRMGGKPAPFGVDEEVLDGLVDVIEKDPWLHLTGVHLFAGTQILDHQVLLAQYAAAIRVARTVGERTGRPIETIDMGGGLGIPYFDKELPLDTDALAVGVRELVAGMVDGGSIDAATRLLVEPGRFLVGESGVYLVRVNDVKVSRGKTFVVVDGGMNHHLAASGNLGQVIKRNFPVVAAGRLREPAAGEADIVGPLCTPLDVLARNVPFPEVAPGDVVAVLQSGAYGRSASPVGFLSHDPPGEVWIDAGTAELATP